MPKKQNQRQPVKSRKMPKTQPVQDYEEEEDEYEEDQEEEEDELENNSFIDNEEEEIGEDGGNYDFYRNPDLFKQRDKKEKAKIKKEAGENEDESYKGEDDNDEDYNYKKEIKKEEEDDNNSQNLNDSDIEIGQQYANTQKKKRRLHKVRDDAEKFKKEMKNLMDEEPQNEEQNDIENSDNDIRENNEEDSQYSNQYRTNKRKPRYKDDNFIEYPEERKDKYYQFEKQEAGIEQLEHYISEEDKIIVSADYPERLVTRYKIEDLKNLSQEIKEEVDWICEQKNYNDFLNKKKKINTLLELFKRDFLDIPYIITYRFYLFEHEFQEKELWEIFELDYEYQKLVELRKKVMNNFNALEPYLNEKIYHNMKEKCIDNAKSIQDLNSMMNYINYNKDKYLPKDVKPDDEFILPVRKTSLNVQFNSKLEKVAERFCLNTNDIASNLELIKNKESLTKLLHPPVPDSSLSEMIQELQIENMTHSKVMDNICSIMAKEMLTHPYIKEYVYDHLRHNCYVSTTPTEEGNKQLDVFNPSFRVKRIKERPVKSFFDDLFLEVSQKEKEKLIEINIEIKQDPESTNIFKELFNQALNNEQNSNLENDEYGLNSGIKREKDDDENDFNYNSNNKSDWYIFRENIIKIFLEMASKQFLVDVKKELKEEAENYVINSSAEAFEKLLMCGPYTVKMSNDEWGLRSIPNSKKIKRTKKNQKKIILKTKKKRK